MTEETALPSETTTAVDVTVNGRPHRVEVRARELLADLLRDHLRLTGTHLGCEHGVCGACTVLVDGRPVRSCLMLAVQAQGRSVTTVEGLSTDGRLTPLQQAFNDHHAMQCGFCTPGFLMSLQALLDGDEVPSDEELLDALGGHLCRCTGYQNIVAAARQAVAHREGAA